MADFKQVWLQYRRLLVYVKPYRGRLITGMVFSILYGPTNVAVLAVVKRVWAHFFEEAAGSWAWYEVAAVASLLPVAMVARGVCDFLGT